MYEVTIKKSFSAAHTLKEIGGRCEELHGHNFVVEVSVTAPELNRQGLAIDFRVLKRWTEEILEMLDHKYLNDIPYFKDLNPSAENIARFIYDRIAEKVHLQEIRVSRVTVWESEDARVSYASEK
ncbi:MAG: 6-carboxytetrahydropterin synthase QueD [Syntrophales bacterium]|nr:6-carboxytetrahydropterin synthase QueD [Syntrophales bacterium]